MNLKINKSIFQGPLQNKGDIYCKAKQFLYRRVYQVSYAFIFYVIKVKLKIIVRKKIRHTIVDKYSCLVHAHKKLKVTTWGQKDNARVIKTDYNQ